jgi:putative FmdB family regulatory protein
MPIFEYICKECDHRFELIVNGNKKAACPDCQSRRLEKQLSVFAVNARAGPSTGAVRETLPMAPCGSCGDPRGPGACSLN